MFECFSGKFGLHRHGKGRNYGEYPGTRILFQVRKVLSQLMTLLKEELEIGLEAKSPRDIETGPTPVDTSLKAGSLKADQQQQQQHVPCMQQQQQQQQLFYQQQQHSYQQMMSQPCYEQYQPSFQQPQPHYQQLHPSYKQPQPCYEHYQPFFQQPQPPYQQLHPSYMQPQPQYQQQNPSYMQPPPPIHQVPYSLKMFRNEYFKISTFGISFVIILLGNIILFLKAL